MTDHGMVLKPEHIDYTDLKEIGSISIAKNVATRQLEILISDFEFEDDGSCRQNTAKAIAWARDMLDAALRTQVLIPGGTSSVVVASD